MRSSREASKKTSRPFWQSSFTAGEPAEEEEGPTADAIAPPGHAPYAPAGERRPQPALRRQRAAARMRSGSGEVIALSPRSPIRRAGRRGSGGGGPRGARPAPAACPAAAEVGDVTGAAKLLCPDDLKGVALDILARLGRAVGPPGHPGASGAPVVGGDVTEGYKSPLVPSERACGLRWRPAFGLTRAAGVGRLLQLLAPGLGTSSSPTQSLSTWKKKNTLLSVSALPSRLVCATSGRTVMKHLRQKGLWDFAF